MKLDFRTKLLMALVIATVSISGKLLYHNPILGYAVGVFPFILLLLKRNYSFFFKGLLLVVIGFGLGKLGEVVHFTWISGMSLILSKTLLTMIPGIIAGYYAFSTTTMSDMTASLAKWHLPQPLLIPFSLLLRFFYAIADDGRQIRNAMKIQGLWGWKMLRHPLESFEYVLVPLLSVSVKTADEVALCAMTRGLIPGEPRTTISQTKLHFLDYVVIAILLLLLIYYIWEVLL